LFFRQFLFENLQSILAPRGGDHSRSLSRKEHCRRAADSAGSPYDDDHLAADRNRHYLHHTFTTLFGQ